MTPIEDLLAEVMILAPSVPEPIALRYLREAARDLCEAAPIWSEWDSFTVGTSNQEYVTTFPDAEIVAIRAARLDRTVLHPVSVDWLDMHYPDWGDLDLPTAPARFVTQVQADTITLFPRQAGTLKCRLVLKPSLGAETLPDVLMRHATTIGRGAAGRILILPNAEYANPQLGSVHLADFNRALLAEKRKALKGQQGASMRTTPRYF